MNVAHFVIVIVAIILVGYAQHDVFASTSQSTSAQKNTLGKTTQQDLNLAELAKNPQFLKKMIEYMKKNHDFTQQVVTSMLKDSTLRLQIIGHMSENKDAMKQMTEMISQNATGKMKIDHSKMSTSMKMSGSMKTSK